MLGVTRRPRDRFRGPGGRLFTGPGGRLFTIGADSSRSYAGVVQASRSAGFRCVSELDGRGLL